MWCEEWGFGYVLDENWFILHTFQTSSSFIVVVVVSTAFTLVWHWYLPVAVFLFQLNLSADGIFDCNRLIPGSLMMCLWIWFIRLIDSFCLAAVIVVVIAVVEVYCRASFIFFDNGIVLRYSSTRNKINTALLIDRKINTALLIDRGFKPRNFECRHATSSKHGIRFFFEILSEQARKAWKACSSYASK